MLWKIGILRNCTKFTEKHLYQSLMPAILFKKRHWHRCFPVNFVKFLKTPFYIEHLWWLLLESEALKYVFHHRFSLKKQVFCCFNQKNFWYWTPCSYQLNNKKFINEANIAITTANDVKRSLNITSLYFIWFSLQPPEFFYYQLWTCVPLNLF